jgi:putative transposase
MRQAGLRAQRGYKAPKVHYSGKVHPAAPNLLERQFEVAEPNKWWVSDITYSVPGAQGKHGCLNEPRVYLKYIEVAA